MIGQNSEPIELLLYIMSLYLKDSLFKARQVTPWLLSPFSVCPFPYHQICNPQLISKVWREITVLNLNGISQLVLVMINCRTLEAVYFLRWGVQSFCKPLVRVFQNLWSMFDSTQAAALVALCSSFLPGEMALCSYSLPYVFMVIAKSLKMLQCVAINAAPQHHHPSLLLSCTLGSL